MSLLATTTSEANFLWGHTTARCFADLGVEVVFFSPGSRSTPLVLGCEQEPRLSCFPLLDERTAAFFALGHSKRTGTPPLLVCTSGSAPTHWYPAVTEASYSGVPLLILSADRPPELQECGAGQTINQQHLFGSFVRKFYSAPLPQKGLDSLAQLQSLIAQSYSMATSLRPGPVHLNFAFREPLWPNDPNLVNLPDLPATSLPAQDKGTKNGEAPWIELTQAKHPVIIAGLDCPADLPPLFDSIPILCDSLSPLRETQHPSRILRYENLLRCPKFTQSAQPDLFIVLGPLPTSKTLRSWIEQSGAERVVIEPSGRKVDPLTGPSRSLVLPYNQLSQLKLSPPSREWLKKWTDSEKTIDTKWEAEWDQLPFDSEPKIVRILSEKLPKDAFFFCANSMPIRDIEWFWKGGNLKRKLFGARGVNGIDGTLGTAMGLAHLAKQPAYLLTGDLAFLHDSNALLFSSDLIGSLTVFLINNHGGGIFENLAVSQLSEFEKCFATPQSCDFEKLCSAHSVCYTLCKSESDLTSALLRPPSHGVHVIEIKTNRKTDQDVRRHLLSISPIS